jgi:hypothetical protein
LSPLSPPTEVGAIADCTSFVFKPEDQWLAALSV